MTGAAGAEPGLPDYPSDRPLFVFDGNCVLCSTGAGFVMRHDKAGRVNFASAQSPLGRALYAHFELDMDETYLLVDDGRAYTRSAGYLRLARILRGWWRLGLAAAAVPRPVRDWLYDRIANNRYRWFGRAEHCALLSDKQRARLIG